jgi:hypothetical protein
LGVEEHTASVIEIQRAGGKEATTGHIGEFDVAQILIAIATEMYFVKLPIRDPGMAERGPCHKANQSRNRRCASHIPRLGHTDADVIAGIAHSSLSCLK